MDAIVISGDVILISEDAILIITLRKEGKCKRSTINSRNQNSTCHVRKNGIKGSRVWKIVSIKIIRVSSNGK